MPSILILSLLFISSCNLVGVSVFEDDAFKDIIFNMNCTDGCDFTSIFNATFLRLDTKNDPLTGDLELEQSDFRTALNITNNFPFGLSEINSYNSIGDRTSFVILGPNIPSGGPGTGCSRRSSGSWLGGPTASLSRARRSTLVFRRQPRRPSKIRSHNSAAPGTSTQAPLSPWRPTAPCARWSAARTTASASSTAPPMPIGSRALRSNPMCI